MTEDGRTEDLLHRLVARRAFFIDSHDDLEELRQEVYLWPLDSKRKLVLQLLDVLEEGAKMARSLVDMEFDHDGRLMFYRNAATTQRLEAIRDWLGSTVSQ